SPGTGTALSDVAADSPASVTIARIPATSVRVEGNKFLNFTSPVTAELIKIVATSDAYGRGVRVASNIFDNCSPVPGDEQVAAGQVGVLLQYFNNVTFESNTIEAAHQGMKIAACSNSQVA